MTLATDPAENLAALLRCPSVTPEDNGALDALEAMLGPLGFRVERPVFSEPGTPDIANLYARLGNENPHLMFAGHTDVVPPGDEAAWTHPPFSGVVVGGEMWGRGAVDMKGGIACFVAALARRVQKAPLAGSVSLLITGDEEGPAVNGTVKLLEWAAGRGERWDASLVGEPTNVAALGDMAKIGRRGSLSGRVAVQGVQGHVAYPHLADNPLRHLPALLGALLEPPFDTGTAEFPATNLELTSVDTGNRATNVIPARVTINFNIRFNDRWTAETLQGEVHERLDRAGGDAVSFDLEWRDRPSEVFLTRDERLVGVLAKAVQAETARAPELSTTGGTSDARFIKNYCPVVEFGLVGRTMHKVDERVPLAELEGLTRIYERFLEGWFGQR
ncbi:MAG: succinyl-diaminopimelate desuccinylase [Mesorhizobium amorphae]|nr:MAG: succinyl-diaminopimelate desuccinylase [Mesorhizobium amorphae]